MKVPLSLLSSDLDKVKSQQPLFCVRSDLIGKASVLEFGEQTWGTTTYQSKSYLEKPLQEPVLVGQPEMGLVDDRGLVWGSLEDKPLVNLRPKASPD